ncbi:SUKH-4 family immunity protein [Streptomyces sp. NPDC101209]|uniref:SUKH-4 family immunity protein n=1 Tax=Streptomyces sp. NPDC101209 TaxID=3366129 RepID=UPI0038219340
MGKTDFLNQMRQRISESIWIDCRGMTADAVALRMREECRARPTPGEVVILLANVQYAGELLTSAQPERIAGVLAPGFRRFGGREVWVMAERDPELMPVSVDREYDIMLTDRSPNRPDSDESRVDARVRALAVAELRRVPLAVWQLLCASADAPSTEEELLALARRTPDVLSVTEVDSGAQEVGFVSDALAHAWRRVWPGTANTQRRVVEALSAALGASRQDTGATPGPVARYATRALPMHAALAGSLPDLLDDGRLLARFAPTNLYEALAVAYLDGVPYASTAALLHYLEAQGMVPSTQGEWVAWLHHAALCAGRTELADQLVSAAAELPWRTVWTRWRPPGLFGLRPQDAGRVDEFGITGARTDALLVTARDTTTGKHATPRYAYLRQEWDPSTGDRASTPVTVRGALVEGDGDWVDARNRADDSPVVFARHGEQGWERHPTTGSLPPRCPASVTQAVRITDTWCLAGAEGLFAVTTSAVDAHPQQPYAGRPLVAAHCRAAPWPLPDRASAALRGDGLREWLEETFGAHACHRLDTGQLPSGISDAAARRFLTETGLPEIRDFLHLAITPRGDRPLHEVPWPGREGNIPRHLRARTEPPSNGPFYELGSWMYSKLLLDGTTGRVLRDTTGGLPEPLAGSSLVQFFAMVRLFDEFRRAHRPGAPDHKDARNSLATWCRHIDPEAAQGEVWTHILQGYDFEDSTWDLATYGDDDV